MNFEMQLEDNVFSLYKVLVRGTYVHSPYKYFQIFDNKKRSIFKAEVKDRIIHQIIYDYLISLFEKDFISDSYASRKNKGQYKAVDTFRYFTKLASCDSKKCFVLKCDVKKYFDNIDHNILLDLISAKITDSNILIIIKSIIYSYNSESGRNKGVPLGNITSQIFANIYLNVLDYYTKEELGCRYYVRYNDDIVVMADSEEKLIKIRNSITIFAKDDLLLEIPLAKTSIRKITWGVDFLGFTILPKILLLRNKTKNKIYNNISQINANSYFGILKHCNSYNLTRKLLSMEKIRRI